MTDQGCSGLTRMSAVAAEGMSCAIERPQDGGGILLKKNKLKPMSIVCVLSSHTGW